MPAALVRPYVRVIPITHVAPAYPRSSPIPARPAPVEYRPRHSTPVTSAPVVPRPRPRPRRRRRYPTLAWGALLVTLATSGVALRPEPVAQLSGHVTSTEIGRRETAVVPADANQAGLAPADEAPADQAPADQVPPHPAAAVHHHR
ncbi:hypothetical protein [Dactylosporangium salmoneum]|uniref:Uncharacterized protein n=1 Tax=Dactylosporangium salmoneum TaxID=53361 RepID=A0ABP5U7D1_9ACTN